MTKFVTLAALALSSVAASASAGDWKHNRVVSAEGVAVDLDYTLARDPFDGCYKCQQYVRTSPLWINVVAPGLGAGDKVRVVLVNKRDATWTSEPVDGIETRELDLAYAEDGRFTVEAGSLQAFGSGYGGNEIFTLEVAVVINGTWLKDPVGGTSNFSVTLARD